MSWLATALVAGVVHGASGDAQDRASRFLGLVNAAYQALGTVESEAQWDAVTDVKPEHDAAAETAAKASAAFNGNPALIREARELLAHEDELTPLTVRQLQRVLLNAAEAPMTNPDLVARRIEAEVRQASKLNSFEFRLNGRPITPNEIDNRLQTSRDLAERRAVWEASKQTGPALKPGLVELQPLRNGVARELGHSDYFALQSAKFDMTTEEVLALMDGFMRELRPLYLQLHTWTKHELAKRYGQPAPNRIPTHWINNRWAQEWNGLVEAANLDEQLKDRSAEWVVKTAEQFFLGMGFKPLPATFWTKSDLYPLAPGDTRKKNTHASCWHVDLRDDIRSLMSVEPNTQWFFTTHHELGHAFYDQTYTRPDIPYLLRTGANPAFHEGMAMMGEIASGSESYLKQLGVLPPDAKPDPIAFLLNDALANSVPFIFWASGVMAHWEADVYAKNLSPDEWNARWWQYKRDFQGVEPPAPRGEELCDAATKTHINDVPCYYFSYAIATVLKFQLHDHIARKVLRQPPHNCNYANHPEAGEFLRSIMKHGASRDWRELLREATGEDLSTRAMVEYFKPLMAWLEKENAGRKIGWE